MIFYIMVHEHFKNKKPMTKIIYAKEVDDFFIQTSTIKERIIQKPFGERKLSQRIKEVEKSLRVKPLIIVPADEDSFAQIQKNYIKSLSEFEKGNIDKFKKLFFYLLESCNSNYNYKNSDESPEIAIILQELENYKEYSNDYKEFIYNHVNLFYNPTIQTYYTNEIEKKNFEEFILLKKHTRELNDTKTIYRYEIFMFIALIIKYLIYKFINFVAPKSLPYPIKEGGVWGFFLEETAPKTEKNVNIKVFETGSEDYEIYVENTPLEAAVLQNQKDKKQKSFNKIILENWAAYKFLKQYDIDLISGRETVIVNSLSEFLGEKISDTKIKSIITAIKAIEKEAETEEEN